MALRLDRAASELNPFLMLVTVGLLLLNLVLYVGLSLAHPSSGWRVPARIGAGSAIAALGKAVTQQPIH